MLYKLANESLLKLGNIHTLIGLDLARRRKVGNNHQISPVIKKLEGNIEPNLLDNQYCPIFLLG